ncbi:hypothetical protein B0H66DRAFT_116194 [Apodospora peruviana]|uniref:Uncharacterized protein n=1 Tax=Apodospora peruviana TaxID=516989 RepID=A0AAE0IHF8_9PEZI|nr:hypothetical protein B0H66DRAFT_116194 [Apodospora peruviana]
MQCQGPLSKRRDRGQACDWFLLSILFFFLLICHPLLSYPLHLNPAGSRPPLSLLLPSPRYPLCHSGLSNFLQRKEGLRGEEEAKKHPACPVALSCEHRQASEVHAVGNVVETRVRAKGSRRRGQDPHQTVQRQSCNRPRSRRIDKQNLTSDHPPPQGWELLLLIVADQVPTNGAFRLASSFSLRLPALGESGHSIDPDNPRGA